MKKLYLNLLLFLICNFSIAQTAFIQNKGQWDNTVQFKAEFNSGNLYIENATLNYNFIDNQQLNELVSHHHQTVLPYEIDVDWTVKGHCLKMNIANAQFKNPITKQKTETYYNYFLGNDKTKWKGRVPAFQTVTYPNVYPNIDFTISSSNNYFKYEFVVKAQENPNKIQLTYEGANNIILNNNNLQIETSVNTFTEQKPYAYQIIDNKEQEVACYFKLENHTISFDFPNGYNKNYDLVIDPYIVFSRYTSSYANNFGYTATYDSYGNAYGAGSVFNQGYITTPGAYDISFNGFNTDIGITKYSSDGLTRLYATYLGGNKTELPHSIVVNSRDELYVLGTTSSDTFPVTLNCYDSTYNGGSFVNLAQGLGVLYTQGSDFIVSRFTEGGDSLMASTYIGGSANDGLNLSPFLKYNYADEVRGEILIDHNDNCIITSCTYSNNFPVLNSIDTSYNGGLDGVAFKMDANLNNLLWSTYLGGSLDDASYSISFDSNEDIYLAGGTQSPDFPLLNAYQDTFGGGRADGFIARLHNTGSNLISSTYMGSTEYDQIYFIDLNNNDDAHIFGQTKDTLNNFYHNALYSSANGGQFLMKYTHNIDSVIWSTRFGDGAGKPDISPTAFLVDVCNQVFLSGWGGQNLAGNTNLSGTAGLDITSDALQPTTDNRDFYFMVMRDDASALIYASYFGGNISAEHVDGGTSRFDKKGVIYQAVCAGCGNHQDFPTVPIDSAAFWTNNNSCNLGLVKYAFSPPSVIADFVLPQVECIPQDLTFINTTQTAFNDTSQTTFYWYINDSLMSNDYHFAHSFNEIGVYNIKLVAIDSLSCNLIDSISKQITLLGNGSQNLDTLYTCKNNAIQIGISPIQNPNVHYQWSPSYGLNDTTIANPVALIDTNTTYTLIAGIGTCLDTFVQHIIVRELNTEIWSRDTVCLGDTITFYATNLPNAYYNWQPDTLLNSPQGQNLAVFEATYSPFYVSCQITDQFACKDTVADTVFVTTLLPDISATATPDTIEMGDTSQLEALSSLVNNFVWDNNASLSATDIFNPTAFPTQTTTYTVHVNDNTCPNKTTVTVYVTPKKCIEDKLFVPNAFTPNNDGNNDIFYVRSRGEIRQFYFAVYDRWGQKVFETYDINTGWDGSFNGENLSPAAFAWYCSGFCENGEDFILKGNVSILK
ncbi:MAG: gliding motility-associated C-terminal domain-containing protein [Chitinophagales bacterium]|nr:gliding motility-associated C-terminal domain-containing protein [Chitinophagales bacterium]